ncbi:MAG: putative manganese transporter, partial [Pseudomonadota bacterium]|nr:putative manganese transporter [Pseudomonadota bacterium]
MQQMQPPADSIAPRGDGIEDITTLFFAAVAVVAAAGLFLTSEQQLVQIIFGSVADAYLQVTTFVASTFLLIYGAEKFLKFDAVAALRRDTAWQVPMAAALGAMPGCGGAVIVVTQFVTGRLSFGSVVATLTATMGDAAFLLLAQEPLTGLAMIALGFVVGTLTGWVVNFIHGGDFLRGNGKGAECPVLGCLFPEDWKTRPVDRIWMAVLVPGIVLGLLAAFQIDVDAILSNATIEAPAT